MGYDLVWLIPKYNSNNYVKHNGRNGRIDEMYANENLASYP